jgi:ubiquinone/menaquinone biosynthesis C-methylase UbiE
MTGKRKSPGFAYIAEHIFAPIYPVIANHIVTESGVTRGTCLDLGCGIASLGIAVAQITGMQVYGVDLSKEMCRLSQEKALRHEIADKVVSVIADVHMLPFRNSCVDLIVSRGSVFFWNDLPVAFNEIARVLAPAGQAWIGGGFGTKELREQISKKMVAFDPQWHNNSKERLSPENLKAIENAGGQTELVCHTVRDDSGFWAVLSK